MLDERLDLYADDPQALLQRFSDTSGIPTYSVTVRAWVRQYTPEELNPFIIQGDSKVIISPSDLAPAQTLGQWPSGQTPAVAGTGSIDSQIPQRGDQIVIHGRPRQVVAAAPIYPGGQLVRIDLQCRG